MLAESEMGVDADMIGMFKTNIKGFCKYTIENTKDKDISREEVITGLL